MFEVGGIYRLRFGGYSCEMECVRAGGGRFIMRRVFDGALVDLYEGGGIAGYKDVGQDWVYFNKKGGNSGDVFSRAHGEINAELRRREEAYEEDAAAWRRRRDDDVESCFVGYW